MYCLGPKKNSKLFVFIKVYIVVFIFIQEEVHKSILPSDPKLVLWRQGYTFSCGIIGSENKSINLGTLCVWEVLWSEHLCPPKVPMLNPNDRCDGFRTWGL